MEEIFKVLGAILLVICILGGVVWGLLKLLPEPKVYICDKWEDVYYITIVGWVNGQSRLGAVSLEEAKIMAGENNVLRKVNECTQSHWE